ncbi:MAG: ATP-dependent DNA ligase [Candidatus Dormibacterales bacterium]
MLEFARTADAIGATRSKLEKIRLLAGYLRGLSPADLRRASVYLTGRALPAADPRVLGLGWAAIARAVAGLAGKSAPQLAESYLVHSDLGDWTAEALGGRTAPQDVSLAEVEGAFDEIVQAPTAAARVEVLTGLLRRLDPGAARYVIKVLAGDLRIGLSGGLLEDALALAFDADPAAVRRAHMVTGDAGATAELALRGALAEAAVALFTPLRFMLASPVADAAEAMARVAGDSAWTEEKYDGVRCQLHVGSGRAVLFSRDLRETTAAFPEIEAGARALGHDLVLDGEILGHREGRVLRFFELQRRLGRKQVPPALTAEVPVVLVAFDLLFLDAEVLLERPLEERRRRLEGLGLAHPFLLSRIESAQGPAELDRIFEETRGRGNEGLMIKDPASAYSPGRRGLAWLKLKRPLASLDVVVTAVEWGHGKRRGVLSDYTFAVRDEESGRLADVGKAYTGLTDEEIAAMTRHFLDRALVDQGRRLAVQPDTVIEVAFDSIQRSARHESGFALRFPRILRLRPDKPAREIDTLAGVRSLYERFYGEAAAPALAEVAETGRGPAS